MSDIYVKDAALLTAMLAEIGLDYTVTRDEAKIVNYIISYGGTSDRIWEKLLGPFMDQKEDFKKDFLERSLQ